jgi:hypothetical protein
MTTQKTGRRVAVVVFGMAMAVMMGTPGSAEAQSMTLTREMQRAESHEAKARNQLESRSRWDQSAWNFRRAAALRPAGDPVAVENLAMAGRLAYYLGDNARAMRDMEGAAAQALSAGDIVNAATLLTDAAWLAARDGRAQDSELMASRARLLAAAPTFTESRRLEILGRLSAAGIEAPSFSRTAQR